MRAAILYSSGPGAAAARLYAVKLWSERNMPGTAVEFLHNTGDTQTLAAVGLPVGFFASMVPAISSDRFDLHRVQEKFLSDIPFESVNLEKDATFKAVFAKFLETQGSNPKPRF